MSDKLLERIAVALESLVANKAAAPAANKTSTTPTTAASGATTAKGAVAGGAPAGRPPNKDAAKGTPKPAATKTTTPPGGAPKLPNGQRSAEEVKAIILKVVATPGLGKASANDILDEEAGGARNLKDLKPEDYDKVFEACTNALQGGEAGETGTATTETENDLLS